MKIPLIAPRGNRRNAPDGVYPLLDAAGRKFHERAGERRKQQVTNREWMGRS